MGGGRRVCLCVWGEGGGEGLGLILGGGGCVRCESGVCGVRSGVWGVGCGGGREG